MTFLKHPDLPPAARKPILEAFRNGIMSIEVPDLNPDRFPMLVCARLNLLAWCISLKRREADGPGSATLL